MTTNSGLDASENTIKATNTVVNLLSRVAGFVISFSALSYLCGWREASAYYQELGAPWAAPLLTASQIMQTSVGLIIIVFSAGFYSFLSLLEGTSSEKKLGNWSFVFFLLAVIAYESIDILHGRLSTLMISTLASTTSLCWAAAAGLTFGELIASLETDKLKWGKRQVIMLSFIVLFGFFLAPLTMGKARAQLSLDPTKSGLPIVSFKEESPANEWRLVGACGDKLLLISLTANREGRRFKLISSDSIDEIHVRKPN